MILKSLALCLALSTVPTISESSKQQNISYINDITNISTYAQKSIEKIFIQDKDNISEAITGNEYFSIYPMNGKVKEITEEYFIFEDNDTNQLFTFTYDRVNTENIKSLLEINKDVTINITKSILTGIIKNIQIDM